MGKANVHSVNNKFEKYFNNQFWYLKLVGVCPLVYENKSIRLSPVLLIYNYSLIFILTTLEISNAYSRKPDLIINIIKALNSLMPFINFLSFSIVYMKRKNKFEEIIIKIEETEESLYSLGYFVTYGNPPRVGLLYPVLCWILCVLIRIHYFSQKPFRFNVVLHMSQYLLVLLQTINVFGLVVILHGVFVLISTCTDALVWLKFNISIWKSSSVLEALTTAVEDICIICEEINHLLSTQILLTILSHFLRLVLNSYYCLTSKGKVSNVIYILWATMILLVVLCLSGFAEKFKNKIEEFREILYQIMIEDKSYELSRNKKLRLHVSMKRQVEFTACGFFKIDYPLVHSMIAATGTYLAIMVQVGLHDE